MYLLPRTEKPEENAWRFQDMLDYNGYMSFIEGIKEIQRINLEQILDFLPYHETTYLLGKNLANNKIENFGLYYSVKAGTEQLNYQGPLPAFLEVTEEHNC
jgi:hypothetical protein